MKPKSHYCLHLGEQVRRLKYSATCFIFERRHSWVKGLAENAYRYFESALTSTVVQSLLEQWSPRSVPRLVKPVQSAAAADILTQALGRGVGTLVASASTGAVVASGEIRRGDLLQLSDASLGWCGGFYEVTHAGCDERLALLRPLDAAGETGPDTLVALGDVVRAVVYTTKADGSVRVLV